MKIDMSPILSGSTDEIAIDYPLTISAKFYGVTFPEPFHVHGAITDMAGYMSLSLTADGYFDTVCDRCLIPIKRQFSVVFQKTVAQSSTLQNKDNDDYIIIEDGALEIDEPLEEAIILSFPSKHLCREDCKGLCSKCGKDLNEGPCGCNDRGYNPVWDKIREKLEK